MIDDKNHQSPWSHFIRWLFKLLNSQIFSQPHESWSKFSRWHDATGQWPSGPEWATIWRTVGSSMNSGSWLPLRLEHRQTDRLAVRRPFRKIPAAPHFSPHQASPFSFMDSKLLFSLRKTRYCDFSPSLEFNPRNRVGEQKEFPPWRVCVREN